MRFFLTIVLVFTLFTLKAQDKMYIKYYDSQWSSSPKENASFYAEFVKQEDAIYKCTSYYLPSNKLYGKSFNADTTFFRNTGLNISYYESGKLRDSIVRDGYGQLITENKYNENGNLLFHAYHNKNSGKTITEGFDEKGKVDPNYIYDKPAEFPGGIKAWTTYLERHLKSEIPAREKAPAGKYVVFVTFVIDKEGNISNVNAENDPGYGTKEESIRVITNSPKWEPAIKYNESVIYRHKQGITFVVQY